MRNTKYEIRNTKYEIRYTTYDIRHTIRPAFTIVELLIALAITAMLLAAVAVAFNASVINYTENEKIYKAINGARQALFRITSQLRTATYVVPNATATNECTLTTADGEGLTYRYDDPNLYLVTTGDPTNYKLCENVEEMTFTKDIDVEGKVRSVQIEMTVSAGGLTKKLAAAAVIRRNLD